MFLNYLKHQSKTNFWITGALFIFGAVCLKLSDVNLFIGLIVRLFSFIGYESANLILKSLGAIFIFLGFFTLIMWMKHKNAERIADRKNKFKEYAETFNYDFDEDIPQELRRYYESFRDYRCSLISEHRIFESFTLGNTISKNFDGKLFLIFDYSLVVRQTGGDKDSFNFDETAFLIVSDTLDLSYFHTEARHFFNQSFFKQTNIADLTEEISFPQYPILMSKQVIKGKNQSAMSGMFKPDVARFYEQNNFYRTFGKRNLLGIINLQTSKIQQSQISQTLLSLQYLCGLLTK